MKDETASAPKFDAPLSLIARHSLVLSALVLALPRPTAKAEDSVAYLFENYREEDGRITVVTQSSSVNQDIAANGHIQLTGTIDAVSGATPTGRPAQPGSTEVPVTEIQSRRKAWSGDYAEQIRNLNVDASFAESRESDYVSQGWAVNTLSDFNEKNTTLRVGVAGTDDRVETIFGSDYLTKHTHDAIVGITQVLNPTTFVTVNISLGRSTGYLSEPYKIVEKEIAILPGIYLDEEFAENSPSVRNRESLFVSLNHAFNGVRGAIEGSYRLYSDSYGVVANTVRVSWIQHVWAKLIVEPSFRYYTQTAARFYYYDIDNTSIIPAGIPTGAAPNYSSDFRLSAEDSVSVALKATWKASDWMQFQVSYEQYDMHGRDGVTPASEYPRAGISAVGVKFSW
jgi:hypothetical protein